ncbi:MAG: uL14 family ribosomal protein, partial [Patescibacteria group bacterium]
MIQPETLVKIADNTGGTVGKVFKVLGSAHKRYATLGELVIISVKVATPRKAVKKK